ncbi:MAG: hypothetical protein IJ237_10425, partial [Oscillospiraceae bacterium]|nr:hypothetical protein [Oscillospiraceae bacterium]
MSIKIKRVSAWILTLVMLMSMFPVSVFAEEQQEVTSNVITFDSIGAVADAVVSAEGASETSAPAEEASGTPASTEESEPSSQEEAQQPSDETTPEKEPSATEPGEAEKQMDASQALPAQNASEQTVEEPEYDEIVINQMIEYQADPEVKQTLRLILKEDTNLHLFIDGMDLRIEAYNEYYKDEEFEPTDLLEHNDYILQMPAGSYLLSFQPVKWVYGNVALYFMDDDTAEAFYATLRRQREEAVVPDYRAASHDAGDFNSYLDNLFTNESEQEEEIEKLEESDEPIVEEPKEELKEKTENSDTVAAEDDITPVANDASADEKQDVDTTVTDDVKENVQETTDATETVPQQDVIPTDEPETIENIDTSATEQKENTDTSVTEPKENTDTSATEPKEDTDTSATEPKQDADNSNTETEETADEPAGPADLSNGPFYYILKNEPVTLDEVFTA